jgi:hypothetical protein
MNPPPSLLKARLDREEFNRSDASTGGSLSIVVTLAMFAQRPVLQAERGKHGVLWWRPGPLTSRAEGRQGPVAGERMLDATS